MLTKEEIYVFKDACQQYPAGYGYRWGTYKDDCPALLRVRCTSNDPNL